MPPEVLATAGAVRIVITGEGAQFSSVVADARRQLDKLAGKSASAGAAMRGMGGSARNMQIQIGLLDNALRGQFTRSLADMAHGLANTGMLMQALPIAATVAGVVVLGRAILEAAEKVGNFGEAASAAARKDAAQWREVQTSVRATNDNLLVENDKLQDAISKIEGKPRNGIKDAIDEAVQAADQLDDKLAASITKIAGVLQQQQPSFLQRAMGTAGTGDVTQHALDLQESLDAIDIAARSQLEGLRKNGATAKQIEDATAAANQKRVAAVQRELQGWATPEMLHSQQEYQRMHGHGVAGGGGGPEQYQRKQILTQYVDWLGQMQDMLRLNEEHGVLTRTKNQLSSDPGSVASAAVAAVQKMYDTPELVAGLARTMGRMKPIDWKKAGAQLDTQRQFEAMGGGQMAMWGQAAQAKQLAAFNAIVAKYTPTVTKAQTALDKLAESAANLGDDFLNTSQQMSDIFGGTLDTVNSTLMRQLTTPSSFIKGTFLWHNAGASIMRGVGSTLLQHAEGSVMKAFGLSHKPDGTRSKPLWMRDADKSAGGVHSTAGGILGALNRSNWAGKLFGGKLFGPGGFFDRGASGMTTTAASVAGGVTNAVGGILSAIPHFAAGGPVPSGMPALVGENGPELFMPSGAGHIVPNDHLGGTTNHIAIDARGASDPAATEAAVYRALGSVMPHIGSIAVAAQRDHARRTPHLR